MIRVVTKTLKLSFFVVSMAIAFIGAAHADDYTLTLKDHQFTPQNLTVPANQKVKLVVVNQGDAAAEFESSDFHREKVVAAGSQITVNIGPLKPGTYTYLDDFHRESTGTITAQ